MKCSFCGTEVDEKQRFCPNCGLLLDLSFTPFSVKDLEKTQEKTEEPEFLRQKREYQESLDQEETGESDVPELAVDKEETEETVEFDESEEIEDTEELEASGMSEEIEDTEEIEASGMSEEIDNTEEYEFAEEAEETEETEVSNVPKRADETEVPEVAEETEVIEETEAQEETLESYVYEESEQSEEAAFSAILEDESDYTDEDFDEIFEDGSDAIFEEEFEEDSEKDFVKVFSVLPKEGFEGDTEYNSNEAFDAEDFAVGEGAEEVERAHEEDISDEEHLKDEDDVPDEEAHLKEENEVLDDKEEFSPDAKIFSIQERQDEEEFFGEIPDDPDDFRKKSSIPPTSMKELKSGLPSKKIIAFTAAVAILGFAGINYLNSPTVRYDAFLKKGEQFINAEKYSEAVESLEKDKDSFQLDARYYILLSEAQKNAGNHEDAIASLLEGQKYFADNQELKEALNLLDPKLSSDISEELYHDHFDIKLENSSGGKIIYSLSGGKEEIFQAEYTGPISIKRNGNYTLMAYALASDGAKGEPYSKSFTVDLDKEKYHLSSFVDLDGGKGYIDENGDQAIGWILIEGSYYYFNENGIMQTGFLDLDGERYYLDDDGKMHTGRLDLDGKSYYFDEQGHMIRDAWIDNRYYVDENGEMLKNQTNSDGVYFDQNGSRSFDAKALYEEHPESILAIVSKDRKKEDNKYIFTATIYYQKKNGRPSGDPAYETEIVMAENAMMHYLDENLESITAKDAVSFLPNLYLQEIVQDKDGVITKFGFVLGERRS